MPGKSRYSQDIQDKARKLRENGSTWVDIQRRLGVPISTMKDWANKQGWPDPGQVQLDPSQDPLHVVKKAILKATEKKPQTDLLEVLKASGATFPEVEQAIHEMHKEGYDIQLHHKSRVDRTMVPPTGEESHLFPRVKESKVFKIGIIGDNQLGNYSSRLDVLQAAYDHYEAEGITHVYHTGNLIDGFRKRINFNELLPAAGFTIESQCDYAAQVYPKKKNMTTYFITGECHEGWWYKDFGVNVGRAMQLNFHEAGRTDLQYIGHMEGDVELRPEFLKKGVRGPMLRLLHPGGGSSYAYSYKSQKIAESLQGGEKPQIQFIGHFHKFNWDYHREVHNVQTGTTCDQTAFMRKHYISAHVGYLIGELKIHPSGILESFKIEWVPWYDRGFYKSLGNYETDPKFLGQPQHCDLKEC